MAGRSISIISVASIFLCAVISASSQTQTTGRITGTVKDAQAAVIAHAEVVVQNLANADKHAASTDAAGNDSVSTLAPGSYREKRLQWQSKRLAQRSSKDGRQVPELEALRSLSPDEDTAGNTDLLFQAGRNVPAGRCPVWLREPQLKHRSRTSRGSL